ncbi:MAG: hypothetical protein OXN23_04670 [Gammaproteobacteria bacterium]|nr:hypothetical protein [Gammaproteobacteria bacterium]MDE0302998.1 hypothetical protein [Gammaproteobacteria bacterium]MDE0611149.1 hypothetical protein [Gammaproteobacteria bacterium]
MQSAKFISNIIYDRLSVGFGNVGLNCHRPDSVWPETLPLKYATPDRLAHEIVIGDAALSGESNSAYNTL